MPLKGLAMRKWKSCCHLACELCVCEDARREWDCGVALLSMNWGKFPPREPWVFKVNETYCYTKAIFQSSGLQGL